MRKKYIRYYTVFIIVALLFVCKGAARTLTIPDSGTLFAAGGVGNTGHYCCDNKFLKISFFEHTFFDFTIPSFLSLLLLSLISIFRIFWHKWYSIFKRGAGDYYVRHIRYNFGGWNIFLATIFYFRLGILHPKIH